MMKSDSDESRPAIWAEGSQKPPFEPRAFARVALKIGRETVSGILARCGSSARDIGGDLRAGRLRIPEERLGHTGRFLPSASGTGRAVLGGAGILHRASEITRPNAFVRAPKDIDAAYRDLFRGRVAPAEAAPLAQPLTDQLAAIRDMLRNPQQDAAETARKPGHNDGAPEQLPGARAESISLTRRLRHAAGEGAALILGCWMIAFALPYGAIRAGLAHFRGEDLRKIRSRGE
ncbi:hypothetical protein [Rhodobacter sp. 24-YEA-8]|uniref:hypothetical protein n=1 Tax=Rhodobacter sp. 24-YEA-8 TaxID=1884310 RepID=UPI0008945754|nr:hypothetical protein [Rhodobacter sp. 24-YEA-8]SEB58653.1 hypothetical protein SAMN05519105_0839 [Rhodobacter sp. 24-YEA-8]